MVPISVFDLFSIGIGPSSSHTVGPMRAALSFVKKLQAEQQLSLIHSIKIELYGSLALTGKGHGTDIAVMLGMQGYAPESIDPNAVDAIITEIRTTHVLNLLNLQRINFEEAHHLLFHYDKKLPYHPNAMRFTALDGQSKILCTMVYYSLGGGFIIDHESTVQNLEAQTVLFNVPYPFLSGKELLALCTEHNWTIAQLMMENEKKWRTEEEVRTQLLHIWSVMKSCIDRGCQQEGVLPGGLNVKRRTPSIAQALAKRQQMQESHPAEVMEWLSLWALAVNEENAAGGRVVTAPTNGAAGVIPSVLHYYKTFNVNASDQGVIDFLLTAGAMGILFKVGASISAAEMGCMGEVGVACAMAAAGLTAAYHGTNLQIENAAEIGMEHHLGLTCDPVKGLVQIPCIERNTMGAIKAVNACLLSLQGDGVHHISLDQVIATMRQTGMDMNTIYKETSLGGLAVNVPEC